ncbi:MAG: sigma 54-interacting transcriptional regulator [Deltaproteobacteria bacterium]|nr:sigma 54-interacting transcriptional regulator [Deltaproteobacteria bacterium]
MPHVVITQRNGQQRREPLFRAITTVGSGADCDLPIDDDESVARCHAHIQLTGDTAVVVPIDASRPVLVNGRKVKSHALAEGDVVEVGQTRLLFRSQDLSDEDEAAEAVPGAASRSDAAQSELSAYRRLHEFSRRLMSNASTQALLETLMDEAIAITRADKGFLILLEDRQLNVRVARNLKRENIEEAVSQLSDSIVAKVVRSKLPLIVSDALNDTEFNSSLSVVNLRLCSVMCVPLLEKGEVFGLIYVGNDRVANMFTQTSLELLTVFAAQASLLVQNALLVEGLTKDKKALEDELAGTRYGDIIGSCDSMKEVYKRIEKVATTDISVLITGETGTGKELIAHEIHRRSPRAKGPFGVINCGAIPENLLESELFGHVRGAFTGAVATRAGKFQAADGGTLFLDEIGEMPPMLQVKLLRALQEKTVTKVGDTRSEPVDIRVIAATNKNLEQEIAAGRFREDLYYRLNVVHIHLPPLCERGEDLIVIAKFLLAKYNKEYGSKVRGFSSRALQSMRKHRWPGNIRQLENRIKRAVVLCERSFLSEEDLDIRLEDLEPILSLAQAKEEFQRRYINQILGRNNGNRTKTARDLDVDPRTIYRHLEREAELQEQGGETGEG